MKSIGKRDILIICALVVGGALLALLLNFCAGKGSSVNVYVDGNLIETFSLDADVEETVTGFDGGQNLLVIAGGRATIKEADCPDKLCVNMGWISKNGQSVICLPNRVVIEIVSEEKAEYDGVAR